MPAADGVAVNAEGAAEGTAESVAEGAADGAANGAAGGAADGTADGVGWQTVPVGTSTQSLQPTAALHVWVVACLRACTRAS